MVATIQKHRRFLTPGISLTLFHNLWRGCHFFHFLSLCTHLPPPKTQAIAIVWKMRSQYIWTAPQGKRSRRPQTHIPAWECCMSIKKITQRSSPLCTRSRLERTRKGKEQESGEVFSCQTALASCPRWQGWWIQQRPIVAQDQGGGS